MLIRAFRGAGVNGIGYRRRQHEMTLSNCDKLEMGNWNQNAIIERESEGTVGTAVVSSFVRKVAIGCPIMQEVIRSYQHLICTFIICI